MTKVYLIRHVEAESNLYRRVHGHYDSHVTPRGRLQVQALVERFHDEPLSAVYSSDLMRATETGKAIADDHGLPLIENRNLRECGHGAWEDMTWGDIQWKEPVQWQNYLKDPDKWSCSGAERFYPLQRRMTKAILEIARENDGKTVAVIVHGYALRAFLCGVYGYRSDEFSRIPHCDNAAVTLLEIDQNKIDVKYYGDASHLNDEISTFAHQNWWRNSKDDSNLHFTDISGEHFETYVKYLRKWYDLCGMELNELTIKDAMLRSAFNPKSIVIGYIGDKDVGCIDVEVEKGEINFVVMDEAYRGRGLAVQLIGQAVNVCRDAGYDKIHVRLPKDRTALINFFKADYYVIVEEDGETVLMEKDLSI